MSIRQSSSSFCHSPSKKFHLKNDKTLLKPLFNHHPKVLSEINASNRQHKKHTRHSSIESTNMHNKQSKENDCLIGMIKNRSFLNGDMSIENVDPQLIKKSSTKRNAYLFFDKFKQQQLSSPKVNKYRLPKITKTKIMGADEQQAKAQHSYRKVDKSKSPTRGQESSGESKIFEKLTKFRQRCQKQSDLDSLQLSVKPKKAKLFFEGELLENKENKATLTVIEQIDTKRLTKFQLIENRGQNVPKSGLEGQNSQKTENRDQSLKKVPDFLLERVSASIKDLKKSNTSLLLLKKNNSEQTRYSPIKRQQRNSPQTKYQIVR